MNLWFLAAESNQQGMGENINVSLKYKSTQMNFFELQNKTGENLDAVAFLIRNVYTEARKTSPSWKPSKQNLQKGGNKGRGMKKNATKVGPNLGLGPGETETNKLEKQDPHKDVLLLKNIKIGMKTIHCTTFGKVPTSDGSKQSMHHLQIPCAWNKHTVDQEGLSPFEDS